MFKKYLITILLVGVVILSSCKSTASSTEEDTTTEVITTLAGTHWKLQSINGVNLLPNSYTSAFTSATSRHWATPAVTDMADSIPKNRTVNCSYQTLLTL